MWESRASTIKVQEIGSAGQSGVAFIREDSAGSSGLWKLIRHDDRKKA